MFDWVFEGRLTTYLLIGLVALVLTGLWYRDRRRHWLLVSGGVASLLLLYFLLDRLVETRREEIERKLLGMAAAVKKRHVEGIFQHISDRFQMGNLNKQGFRHYVERAIQGSIVTELKVWEFHFPDESGKVHFFAKPESAYTRGAHFLIRAEFVRDGDGQWRLKGFEIFNPFVDTTRAIEIPPL